MRQGLSTSEAGKLGAIESAKTAVIRKQKRIDAWNENPKLCNFCKTPLSYNKRRNDFCDQSCGANYHNQSQGHALAGDKMHVCLFCKTEFKINGTHEPKYCSRQCMIDFWWEETKTQMLADGYDNSSANHTGKKFLMELHGGTCQICHKSKWEGNPMPLVLDHISGNPYDNSLTNLRVICHNCNAQTPTFAGRNKGNGRVARAKRYKVEKQIFAEYKADIV